MEDVFIWLKSHWGELMAMLGIGGGAGFAGKKLTDRVQDKKINGLSEGLESVKKNSKRWKE